VPFILDLNMDDEARSRGILIDQEALSRILGIEVVKTVAIRKSGIDKLLKGIQHPRPSPIEVRYDDAIEGGARDISALLPEAFISRRALALMVLAGDESLKGWLHATSRTMSSRRSSGSARRCSPSTTILWDTLSTSGGSRRPMRSLPR